MSRVYYTYLQRWMKRPRRIAADAYMRYRPKGECIYHPEEKAHWELETHIGLVWPDCLRRMTPEDAARIELLDAAMAALDAELRETIKSAYIRGTPVEPPV